VQKRWLFVLSATILMAVGAASYAFAGQADGPRRIPNTKHFRAALDGYQETPAISTTGFGQFTATLDDKAATPTIHFVFSYSNLEGQKVTDGKILFAHVHFGQTGVAGGVSYFLCDNSAVPAVARPCPDNGSGSGTVEGDITADNVIGPNGQGIEPGSFDEIIRAMQAGKAYANIHTTRWGAGEIRGQINSKDD
jgi:hypothetical protein